MKIAAINNENINEEDVENVARVYNRICELEEGIEAAYKVVELIEETMITRLSEDPDDEERISKTYNERLEYFTEKIKAKVT